MSDGALIYMGLNPNSPPSEALDWAMEQFYANHSMMRTPDRLDEDGDTVPGKTVYAFHNGAELPSNFNEVMQDFSDKLAVGYAGYEVNASEYYTFQPRAFAPNSDMWEVRKADGTPVVVHNKQYGYSTPLVLDRKSVVASYNDEQVKAAQQPVLSKAQLAQVARQKQLERKQQEANHEAAQADRNNDVGKQQGRR